MLDDIKASNSKIKLRLKLKSGEEFEAEGDLELVLKQKEDFLRLIANKYQTTSDIVTEAKPFPWYKTAAQQQQQNAQAQTFSASAAADAGGPPQTPNPHIYDEETQTPAQPLMPPPSQPQAGSDPFAIRPRPLRIKEGGAGQVSSTPRPADEALTKSPFAVTSLPPAFKTADKTLWDKLAYCDGEDVIIRRKSKNLKPAGAALVILACAKIMRNVQELSSLELSKCMKLSGYLKAKDRLDRAISAEIRQAAITYDGTKRNRTYRLTHSGLAKAYITAERALSVFENEEA